MLRASVIRTVTAPTLILRCLSTNASKVYGFEEMKRLVEHTPKSTVLIDVREPRELELYKMPNAINIPVQSAPGALSLPAEQFKDLFKFPKPDKDKELVFFCLKGVRAKVAEELAKSYGYEKTAVYPGSINEWLAKGGEHIKPK